MTIIRNILLLSAIVFFASCNTNKTIQLLSKKWDCTQVENLEPLNSKINSSKDSAIAVKMEAALKNLQWTFKKNLEYECSTGGIMTAHGTYTLTANNKSILCTSSSQNTVAIYDIVELTEEELVLKNLMENVNITMHFKVSYMSN